MSKPPYTIVLNKHILVNKILFSIVHCESGPFRKVPNIGFTFEVNRYKRDSYPHYIGGILSLHWAYKLWRFYGDTNCSLHGNVILDRAVTTRKDSELKAHI